MSDDWTEAIGRLEVSGEQDMRDIAVCFRAIHEHIQRAEALIEQGEKAVEDLTSHPMLGSMLKMLG